MDEEWVIYNDSYGIVDTVNISKIEANGTSLYGYLESPYDMVGPFDFNLLQTKGIIAFAACFIMSKVKWQEDQVALRRASLEKRQAAQAKMQKEFNAYNQARQKHLHGSFQRNEQHCRELLKLPLQTSLSVTQIKKAFKTLAKIMHPDVGGSHEAFVEIKQARDSLLASV